MSRQSIYVRHKDEIFEKLLNTYKKCVNRKIKSAISDKNYGYAKALEWVLGIDKTQEQKDQEFAKSIDELRESKK
jgi:hypothetical protein